MRCVPYVWGHYYNWGYCNHFHYLFIDFFLLPLDAAFWILGFPYKTRINDWAKNSGHESILFYENIHSIR